MVRDKDLSIPWNFESDTVTDNITLYAGWEAITFKVDFESNGGSAVVSLVDIEPESRISKPINPTKNHYRFTGWFRDKDLSIPWNFESDTVADNITLYAGWEAITFKVNFESNGGSAVVSLIDIEPESRILKPINPTKNHYRFTGWFRDKDLSIPWNFESDTVNDNLTLYAGWTPITFNVYFDSNGGSQVQSIINLKKGSLVIKPKNPTREGYQFIGWYKDYNSSSIWNFDRDIIDSDLTLYAQWKINDTHSVVNPETNPELQVKPTVKEDNTLPLSGQNNNYLLISSSLIVIGLINLMVVHSYKSKKNK